MLLPLAVLAAQAASGPLDVYGDWIIPADGADGSARGIVTIAEEDGAPVGRISAVGPAYADDPEALASVGLTILWGFEADGDGDKWKGGRIRDPEEGKSYKSKIRREGDALLVQGCVAFFCRDMVWKPADTAPSVTAAP